MTATRRQHLAHVLLFVTPGLWAANYIVARSAPGVIEPHMLAFWRWLFALGLMLPLAWPAWRARWPAWRSEWKDALLLGALGMWVCGAFVYLGGRTTTATNIGLIYAICPVLIAGASAVLFGERFTRVQTAAEAAIVGIPEISTRAFGLALVAAVLPGFGAYQAYSLMQRELGAARTGLVMYLGPLYAALAAWWLLDETPQWYHATAALLILPGIWLATRAPDPTPDPD